MKLGAQVSLVHHGKNVSFSPAFEEYMNAMFLDILCYELGIPEVGHLRRILRRDNQDLTFIGRTSNRSASTSISDELDVVQGRERERERVLKEWEQQLRAVGL
jgi:hypothetical protein